jgi:DNA recombination protein RmuC
MENLIIPAIAYLAGAIITYFITRLVLLNRLKAANDLNQSIVNEKDGLKSDKEQLIAEKNALSYKVGGLEQQVLQLTAANEDQKQSLSRVGEVFKAEFQNLAHEILESKSKNFSETSEKHLKNLLDPLKIEIKDFKDKVDKTYNDEAKERHALGSHIKLLVETSGKVGQQADNLANALKGNVKQQGNWGEMLLESILENSGLTKNREYFLQEFIKDKAGNIIKDENGKGLQPDVTIVYPDQRKVIIDSKVSLVAWEKYTTEDDHDNQKLALVAHINSLKAHVDGLSKKKYPKYANALDYVIMFIPIEPAFLEAVKQDTGLWKYAYDKQILIVGPTNLLLVLKIVADLWQIEKQSQNAIEIAEKAGELYDKLFLFVGSMEEIGTGLQRANENYDKAMGQLSSGKGNVIKRAEELKGMGASAKKQFPDRLIDNSDE